MWACKVSTGVFVDTPHNVSGGNQVTAELNLKCVMTDRVLEGFNLQLCSQADMDIVNDAVVAKSPI